MQAFYPLLLFFIASLLLSCSPLISDLQSAGPVGKNKMEVAAGINGDIVQHNLAVQGIYGITDEVDVGIRYDTYDVAGTEGPSNLLTMMYKFTNFSSSGSGYSLILPITYSHLDPWERAFRFNPSVMYGISLNNNNSDEIFSSAKILSRPRIYFYDLVGGRHSFEELFLGLALNVGLAQSVFNNQFILRAEAGFSVSFSREPNAIPGLPIFSLSLSKKFNFNKKDDEPTF